MCPFMFKLQINHPLCSVIDSTKTGLCIMTLLLRCVFSAAVNWSKTRSGLNTIGSFSEMRYSSMLLGPTVKKIDSHPVFVLLSHVLWEAMQSTLENGS